MDDYDNRRDEELIEEREEYENGFFEDVIDGMIDDDGLDILIARRFEYINDNIDFEPSDDYSYFNDCYIQECRSHEAEEVALHGDDYDFQKDYDCLWLIDDIFEDSEEAQYYRRLVEENIDDAKRYFDSILVDVIRQEHYFERAIDELIFETMDEEYGDYDFDYDDYDYWYDNACDEAWSEDESIKDPFDSFGEIDYPEGKPDCEPYVEMEYYEDDDYIEHQIDLQIMREEQREQIYIEDGLYEDDPALDLDVPDDLPIDYDEEIPDDLPVNYEKDIEDLRNEDLIRNHEKLEERVREFFTRDDKLDRIIKHKLRERKFTK